MLSLDSIKLPRISCNPDKYYIEIGVINPVMAKLYNCPFPMNNISTIKEEHRHVIRYHLIEAGYSDFQKDSSDPNIFKFYTTITSFDRSKEFDNDVVNKKSKLSFSIFGVNIDDYFKNFEHLLFILHSRVCTVVGTEVYVRTPSEELLNRIFKAQKIDKMKTSIKFLAYSEFPKLDDYNIYLELKNEKTIQPNFECTVLKKLDSIVVDYKEKEKIPMEMVIDFTLPYEQFVESVSVLSILYI